MTCPDCGAAMHVKAGQDYLICDYCGTTHYPDANPDGVRVFGDPTEYPCPRCDVPLVQASIAATQVIYCSRCSGLLIDMEAFLFVIEELRARHEHADYSGVQNDPRELDRHAACPKCRRQMDTHPYGGPGNVVLDTCEDCSVNWLDHGELQRIVRAPDSHYVIAMDEDDRDKMEKDAMELDHS